MSNGKSSLTGLSDEEAQEFHKFYIQGLLGFTATAVIAHALACSQLSRRSLLTASPEREGPRSRGHRE